MADSDQDKFDASSAIANAIRAKRGERQSMSAHEMASLEASLLADIEAFDSTLAASSPPPAAAPARPSALEQSQNLGLPAIQGGGVARPAGANRPAASAPQAAAPAEESPTASGLLAQLRQQAMARQQTTQDASQRREQAARQLDQGLRKIFEYCNELIAQLNIILPEIPRVYTLFGSIEFANLVWQKGFCDYRTRAQSAGAQFENVTLTFSLKAAREVVLERDNPVAIEGLKKMLNDSGVVYQCEEIRNARRMVERARFTLMPEVKTSIRWQADLDNACAVLETRNFERFGDIRYIFEPGTLDTPLLEEFSKLVLGQPGRLREFMRR